MKRSTHTGITLVYRYGCPHWVELPESAMTQLLLAHRLRNDLVAVEERHQELWDAVWLLAAPVEAAQAALDAASFECEALKKRMLVDRVQNRSTEPRQDVKAELLSARALRRDAKVALAAVKAEHKEMVRPLLAQLASDRHETLTLVRAEAVEGGLFWATGNDVLTHHDTSHQRVMALRTAGQPAQHRFRRWDGTGTLATQVMWAAGKPKRTPALLASPSSPWRNVFRIEPAPGLSSGDGGQPSSKKHAVVYLRLEKGAQPISLPIVLHRPLPEDADVTDVRVTRRRIAGQYRLSVAVTVRLPAPIPPLGGVPVSVVFGWGSTGGGAVHVARIVSPFGRLPTSLPPQRELFGVLVSGQDCVDVFALAAWRKALERDDSIRAHRDKLMDELRAAVMIALADQQLAEAVGVTAGEVSRWRSPRRFAVLARKWPVDCPVGAELRNLLLNEEGLRRHYPEQLLVGLSTLELWRMRDRHLWEFEAHERDQVIAWRRDAYRKVAAWLCEHASEILLDCPDVAGLRQVPDVVEEDTYPARAGRRQLQFAAPGDLKAAIVVAAHRRGIKVIDKKRSDPDE